MFHFILSVLLAFVACPGFTIAASDTKYTALKFGYDTSSYISYTPNVNTLTDKFSVCVWLRKLYSGNSACPFAYKNYELFMTDSGYYNRLFTSTSLDGHLTSKFTPTAHTWFLYCSTWSLASRTFRVYVNGLQVGTQTTASGRRLQTGGSLTFGNYYPRSGNKFGGEIFNFNMYSKELTATEVAAMYSGGLCTEIPEQLEEYRVIKWEDILKQHRYGIVLDIDTRCGVLIELQSELLKVQERFNSTLEELVGVRRELGATEGELNGTKLELQNKESNCAVEEGNMYQQLISTWDSISSKMPFIYT